MKSVRQRGTLSELAVRAIVRSLGHRLRRNGSQLPGSPDLYDPERGLAIFVHGCFWHRHTGCAATTTPKANADFWLEKFANNMERDQRKRRQLRKAGYQVLTVWSCQLRDRTKLARLKRRLGRFLS
jgi:DNA mismatch endonuclease, patch repair protein